jgi:two-component system sensor histidine kinase MprB
MSFRARLTLVGAVAVALAVAAASGITYVLVRDQLRGEVDDALRERSVDVHLRIVTDRGTGKSYVDVPPDFLGGAPGIVQIVTSDGRTVGQPASETGGQSVSLPVTSREREIASGNRRSPAFSDAHVRGVHVRIYTVPAVQARFPSLGTTGLAIQIARPLNEVDHALSRIKLWLILVAIGGVGLAATLGLLVSRAALAPVRRLTEATERVTATGDLTERIDTGGRDELSRLAGSFNQMLGALEDSTRAQRQLVADASHELRTPLTSLRTNIEVLASEPALAPDERRRLLGDVVEQLTEMTNLIAELIELARGEQQVFEPEDVRLDLVTAAAVERARRNRPGVEFETTLDESLGRGVPSTIERAVGNLLDNAAKWSPPGGVVEVSVEDGQVIVRDHGPGIDEEDLPYVFDRFYRARSARGMPGSGLGLAIVRQVANAHGGDVVAERAEGSGTKVTLRLDGLRVPAPLPERQTA